MTTKRKRSPAVQNLNTPARDVRELRRQLSTCVGKICAYKDVDKEAEAREWATKLVECLLANTLTNSAILRNM